MADARIEVKSFNPDTVPEPAPSYRQVAVTQLPTGHDYKLVTLAGQTGTEASTGQTVKDFKEQAKVAYTNVLNCLKSAGATPKDIIHVRHYIVKDTGIPELDALDVVDRGWAPQWIEFMGQHAPGHLPPDTVLGVACLAKKELLYEVECWAMVRT